MSTPLPSRIDPSLITGMTKFQWTLSRRLKWKIDRLATLRQKKCSHALRDLVEPIVDEQLKMLERELDQKCS